MKMAEFLEIQENSEERIRFLMPAIIKKMGEIDLLPLIRSRDQTGEDPAVVFGVAPDGSQPVTLTDLANKQLTGEQYQKLSLLYDHIDARIRAEKQAAREEAQPIDWDFAEFYEDDEYESDESGEEARIHAEEQADIEGRALYLENFDPYEDDYESDEDSETEEEDDDNDSE